MIYGSEIAPVQENRSFCLLHVGQIDIDWACVRELGTLGAVACAATAYRE